MKNAIIKAFRRLREALLPEPDREEIPFAREIISRFDKWVETKGYCNPDESMQDVSLKLGISRFELSWVSRRVYGDNFLSLRKKLRICEAERLLIHNPEAPVSLISEMVGINDRTNFRRQFQEVCGMSPQQWRDTHLRT